MSESIIHALSTVSPKVITFILATLPVSELRGAIPYAVTLGNLSWQQAYIIAVIGNFVPVIPILYLVGPVSKFLRKNRTFDRFFEWLFTRTRKRGKVIERFETIGLTLFVAIPLPITGAWTGSLAAFLFGVRKPLAIPAILLGICIAGVVVMLASLGVISFWGIATH